MYTRVTALLTTATEYTWGSLKTAASFVQALPDYYLTYAGCEKADLQKLQTDEEKFIFTELYARARDNNANITRLKTPLSPFIAGWSMNVIPSNIYVITGPPENALQVANYGEKNGDRKARIHFRFFKQMMGRANFTHSLLDSDEMRSERGNLKLHLVQKKDLEYGRNIAMKRARKLFENWNNHVSFLDQMTYLGSNIMGEAVLGIPELDLQYSRQLRDIGKSLSDFYKHPSSVKPATQFIANLNKKLVAEHAYAILAADRFAKKDFDQHADSRKDIPAELLKRKPASWYAAESALSAVLSMGIAQLNARFELKQELKMELDNFLENHQCGMDNITEDHLRNKLPLLHYFYLETLRFSSTLSTTARKTSTPISLPIIDADGVKRQHAIPAESILLFPVRARHFNEKFWQRPQAFDPSRFNFELAHTEREKERVQKNHDELMPFSVGQRSCPSQYGFSEVVFKTVILESLAYKITLDSEIESIPVWAPMPHLEKEYLATVTRDTPEADSLQKQQHFYSNKKA